MRRLKRYAERRMSAQEKLLYARTLMRANGFSGTYAYERLSLSIAINNVHLGLLEVLLCQLVIWTGRWERLRERITRRML